MSDEAIHTWKDGDEWYEFGLFNYEDGGFIVRQRKLNPPGPWDFCCEDHSDEIGSLFKWVKKLEGRVLHHGITGDEPLKCDHCGQETLCAEAMDLHKCKGGDLHERELELELAEKNNQIKELERDIEAGYDNVARQLLGKDRQIEKLEAAVKAFKEEIDNGDANEVAATMEALFAKIT